MDFSKTAALFVLTLATAALAANNLVLEAVARDQAANVSDEALIVVSSGSQLHLVERSGLALAPQAGQMSCAHVASLGSISVGYDCMR
ncbi:MAG: hypothetical protein ACFCUN_05345 [Hyphomicrobiaceae bacterium]